MLGQIRVLRMEVSMIASLKQTIAMRLQEVMRAAVFSQMHGIPAAEVGAVI